jgi:hypothetical protein
MRTHPYHINQFDSLITKINNPGAAISQAITIPAIDPPETFPDTNTLPGVMLSTNLIRFSLNLHVPQSEPVYHLLQRQRPESQQTPPVVLHKVGSALHPSGTRASVE